MGKKKEGFVEGLIKDIALVAIVEASKDNKGKPDPYKAAGLAAGFGHTSLEDTIHLGAMLGSQGAFDTNNDFDSSFPYDSNEEKYEWRIFCEDGSEYGINPEDYETEEEYEDALEREKYGWRESCEDGAEYGINPECYETQDEYNEALKQEKYSWRDNCENNFEYGIDPDDYETEEEYQEDLEDFKQLLGEGDEYETEAYENGWEQMEINRDDFPNQRRYNAACNLGKRPFIYFSEEALQREQERCRFILGKADTILAANYLVEDGEFLYAQAVKDHFDLPITLPDEDEKREYEFYEVISKIAKRDIPLSFEVWEWCLEKFLPYAKYDLYAAKDMTKGIIDGLYQFPDEYIGELVRYMHHNSEFRKKIMENSPEYMDRAYQLVVSALKMNLIDTATAIFVEILDQTKGYWKEIIEVTNNTILSCKTYKELETMENFEKEIFPFVKKYKDGMIQDEIEEWEKEISEYIDDVESCCEQYAFSRKNSWRLNVSDEQKNFVNPLYYNSEEEYIKAYNEEKYRWRALYTDRNNYGLNPNDYEEENKFLNERRNRESEQRKREYEKGQEIARQRELEIKKDETIYIYCGVRFSNRTYHYRTNDETIQVGDSVIVTAGWENEEKIAKVVSVGKYLRIAVPFPVEKTKFILRKVEE